MQCHLASVAETINRSVPLPLRFLASSSCVVETAGRAAAGAEVAAQNGHTSGKIKCPTCVDDQRQAVLMWAIISSSMQAGGAPFYFQKNERHIQAPATAGDSEKPSRP
jgi:hypothetical protein